VFQKSPYQEFMDFLSKNRKGNMEIESIFFKETRYDR
jgi:hypothetical protein